MIKNLHPEKWWQAPQRLIHRAEKRQISFLELFYDLIYVAIIIQLAHEFAHHFNFEGFLRFLFMFILIWWAWWNGSAYHDLHGNDDLRTRVFTFLQIIAMFFMGVFSHNALDEGAVGFALSYGFFQLVLTYLWWRTGVHDKNHSVLSTPYSIMFLINTSLWFISAFIEGDVRHTIWLVAILFPLTIPLVLPIFTKKDENTLKQIELAQQVSHSLVERFGLFTIIVLGEIFIGVISALSSSPIKLEYLLFGGLNLFLVIGIWWIYFDFVSMKLPKKGKSHYFLWNYSHLLLALSITLLSPFIQYFINHLNEDFNSMKALLFMTIVGGIMLLVALLIHIVKHNNLNAEYAKKGELAMIICGVSLPLSAFFINSYFLTMIISVGLLIIPIFTGFYSWAKNSHVTDN